VTEQIEKEIIAILSEVSGVDEAEIKPDTDLAKDLEIDSIKAIEITVAIEKKFKVSVRDEDVPKIMTLRQAVDLVRQLLGQKNAANVKS
jgi:acyl carrier protein